MYLKTVSGVVIVNGINQLRNYWFNIKLNTT